MINQELKTRNAYKMRAQIFNILIGTPNRSNTALKLSLVILTLFHANLIFSDAQSTNYEKWITGITGLPITQVGNGILKVGSTINDLSASLGIYSLTRIMVPGSLVSILFIFALIITLNIFVINNPDWVAWVALKKPTRRGKLFLRPVFKRLMQFVYSYYDLIFAFCLIMGCGTLSCRWIEIESSYGDNTTALSGSFTSDFISNIDFKIQDDFVSVHVNFLHNDIKCLNNDDILLKIAGVVLIFTCIWLRVVFSKLRRFDRNPLCFDSSLDSTDLIQEIVINLVLTITHILSVVLPSNRTQAQKDQLVEEYAASNHRNLQADTREQPKTHIFAGFINKKPYQYAIYFLLIAWLTLYVMKKMILKNKPWLNKVYRNSKLAHITAILLMLEFKIILELFNSWGAYNFFVGKFKTSNVKITPSVPVRFLDLLGYSKGSRGFVFLMIMMVLKIKLSLNAVESSWGYLNNLKKQRQSVNSEENLADEDEASKEDVLVKKDLITVYYLTLKYIDYEIKLRKGKITTKNQDAKEIEMLLLGINQNHINTCRNASCYCKLQQKLLSMKENKKTRQHESVEYLERGEPKDTFDLKFTLLREDNSIKMTVEYLEQQFQNYITFNGIDDDEVIYPYIKFLVLYSGKICKAISLFSQKRRKLLTGGNKINTNADVEDIKIILDRAVGFNQEDGSLYLLISRELLSSNLPTNTYLHPKNVIMFLDSFRALKTLCKDLSSLKLQILNSLIQAEAASSKSNQLKNQLPVMLNFSIKKHLLFKVCSRLRQTEYWGYTPLLILLSWLLGAILEDEWGWGNIMKQVFKNIFKGFYASESASKMRIFKKKIGELGEEWEFKRDFDPVFVYVDTVKTLIYKRNNKTEDEIQTTVRDANKGSKGFKINYVTKNSIEWLGWESRALQSQDVSVIIPQPFKGFHHRYMVTKNLNGSVLMHKSVRPIVCEIIDGSLHPVEIGVRLAQSIDHGFQFIGVLNFSKSSKNSTNEDIILSLNKKGEIIQSSSKIKYYLDNDRNIKDQVFELRKVLPQFDIITNLKNNPKKLAEIMQISLHQLTYDATLDIPYQVLDPLQKYLLYSSDFKMNRVKESEFGSAKYTMQKKSNISLFNRDSETDSTFMVTISDFWHKGQIGGRFMIFHRSLDLYQTGNRPLQFILSKRENLEIWNIWQNKVYTSMVLEKSRHQAIRTMSKTRKATRKLSSMLSRRSKSKTRSVIKSKQTPPAVMENEQEDSIFNGDTSNAVTSKRIRKRSSLQPNDIKCINEGEEKQQENIYDDLMGDDDIEGQALETRRFGIHSNQLTLRNQTSSQTDSKKTKDSIVDEESGKLVEDQMNLMEWVNADEKLNSERKESKGLLKRDRTLAVYEQTHSNSREIKNLNESSDIIADEGEAVDPFAKKEKPSTVKINLKNKQTSGSSDPLKTNTIDFENTTDIKASKQMTSNEFNLSMTQKELEDINEDELVFNSSEDKEEINPALIKKKKKRKKHGILGKIDKFNDGGSESNNRPISAAHSVSSTVVTKFVKIKKTISYLVHHHANLKVDKNNWEGILSDNIDVNSISGKDPNFTKNSLMEITELNIQPRKNHGSNETRVEESEYHEMVSNLKTDKLTRLIFWILSILVMLNFGVFLSREPVQLMAYKDIEYHILTCDIESWAVYSQVHAGLFLDLCRAAREGWIDNESFREFVEMSATQMTQDQWRRSAAYAYPAEKILLRNHSNVTMGFLYPLENWISDYVEVDWIDDRGFDSYLATVLDEDKLEDKKHGGYFTLYKNVTWKKMRLHRTQGMQVTTFMGQMLKLRNYSDFTGTYEEQDRDIPFLRAPGYEQAQETYPTPPDRDRDTFEEFYRRLVVGETANSTFHRSMEFLDFYKAVGKFSESFIYLTGLFIIGISVAGWIIVSAILLWNLSKMRKFWKSLLQVQSKGLKDAVDMMELKEKVLYMLCRDENGFEIYEDEPAAPKKVHDDAMTVRSRRSQILTRKHSKNDTQNNSIISSRKLGPSKIRIKAHTVSFGFYRIIFTLFILICGMAIVQYSFYRATYPDSQKLSNLMKLYTIGVDAWCVFYLMHHSWLSTILWNNTMPYYGEKDSLTVYQYSRNYLQTRVFDVIEDLKDTDVGTFTANFSATIKGDNACDSLWIKMQPLENDPWCYNYYNGLLNANLLSSMKGIISYLDNYMSVHDDYIEAYNKEYENGNIGNGNNYVPGSNGDGYEFEIYPKSHPVLNHKSMGIWGAKFRRVFQVFYYWLTLEPADYIIEEVNKDRQYLNLMSNICLIGFFLIAYQMYKQVVMKVKTARALWVDVVRILPLVCMGEKETVLLSSHKLFLNNLLLNDDMLETMNVDNKVQYLIKLEKQDAKNGKKSRRDNSNYDGIMAIQRNFNLKRTPRGDWIQNQSFQIKNTPK